MNWQKARLIKPSDNGILKVGTELWVKVGPPRDLSQDGNILVDIYGQRLPDSSQPRYEIAMQPLYPNPHWKGMSIRADMVELLARGPGDFTDEPEFATLNELRNQGPAPTTMDSQEEHRK